MVRRLPPLNALRVFEAAARHLSFTRAAGELNVTQAAVSHQIKSLEERLGLSLFRRINRGLLLTDEGQTMLVPVSEALDLIAGALERLQSVESTGILTVSVLPSFAAKWLVPRLGRFTAANPDIDIRLSTTLELVDFVRDGVDIAVRYGRGEWPDLKTVKLMAEDIFPVCSPALLNGPNPLRRPQDLINHTLLHDEVHEGEVDWRMWLLAAGVVEVDPSRGPGFLDSSMTLQAAIAGEGVALGRSVLVADDLAAGRLVKPFDVSHPAEYFYYTACPSANAERPKVQAFQKWLIDEAALSP